MVNAIVERVKKQAKWPVVPRHNGSNAGDPKPKPVKWDCRRIFNNPDYTHGPNSGLYRYNGFQEHRAQNIPWGSPCLSASVDATAATMSLASEESLNPFIIIGGAIGSRLLTLGSMANSAYGYSTGQVSGGALAEGITANAIILHLPPGADTVGRYAQAGYAATGCLP